VFANVQRSSDVDRTHRLEESGVIVGDGVDQLALPRKSQSLTFSLYEVIPDVNRPPGALEHLKSDDI
jgi:hypothetical protein